MCFVLAHGFIFLIKAQGAFFLGVFRILVSMSNNLAGLIEVDLGVSHSVAVNTARGWLFYVTMKSRL